MKHFQDFNLTRYNSYNVNSIAKEVYFPNTEEDFLSLYKSRNDYILIGSGHNIILSKKYYDTPFIILNGNFNHIEMF